MTSPDRDLTLAELDAALASGLGDTADAPPADPGKVAALTTAGLTESAAVRVLAEVAQGLSPEDAFFVATSVSPHEKVRDRSVPLGTVGARVADVLRGSAPVSEAPRAGESGTALTVGDDAPLREALRSALARQYGASAEGVADGALAALREAAVSEGLTREQYEARAYDMAGSIRAKQTPARRPATETGARPGRPVTIRERRR